MKRDNGYYRYQRNRAINRKYGILVRTMGSNEAKKFYGQCKGFLSKGKIHCSCPSCSPKSYMWLTTTDEKKFIRDTLKFKDYLEEA